MELTQNVWERFGFRGNPFDTSALSASADSLLPIAQAIVGREMDSPESKMLLGVVRSPGGGRAVVEGEIGVGKTTFVNYHRYLWEVEAEDRLLTPSTELALTSDFTVSDFVANVIGAILGKLILLQGEKYIHARPLLHELFLLNRVFIHRSLEVQASLLGFGGGVGRTAQPTVPEPPLVQLHTYLRDLVQEVRELGYKGIFLHVDNLELISLRNPAQIRWLFEELRDTLQIPDVYFIFVGQQGFFSDTISPLERVRSVFSGFPIFVPPLTKEQVLEAVNKRYELLAGHRDRFIRPVGDDLLEYLYDLYEGKARFVMDAVSSIVTNLPHAVAETLDASTARVLLTQLVLQRVRRELTRREYDVLHAAVRRRIFTNADISRDLNQQRQNVSKYLNSLLERRFIYPHHRSGRQIFYCVSEDVRIIRDAPREAQYKLFD